MIIYDRTQVALVLNEKRPVTLLSPPGFAIYAGCLWWSAIIAAYDGPALLDCGDAPGRAVEAFRMGVGGIVLAPGANFGRVASIAAACGAMLLDRAPPALDLGVRGATRHLADWLGRGCETG